MHADWLFEVPVPSGGRFLLLLPCSDDLQPSFPDFLVDRPLTHPICRDFWFLPRLGLFVSTRLFGNVRTAMLPDLSSLSR